MRLRISARQSDLARLQAYRVGDALKKSAAASSAVEVQYNFRASLGDINLNEPLWKMPEKGVFTEDFVRDLTEGSAELVVHSWKDLPTLARLETEVVATLPRADLRDLLLFRKDRFQRAKQTGQVKVLTSSPRRSHNLRGFIEGYLPFQVSEVHFEPVRGNIQTRLRKLIDQDVDAIIVAKAAIDRLLEAPEPEFAETQNLIRSILSQVRFMVLPLTINPTAAAQGALAVEVSKKRPDVIEAVKAINCQDTFEAVERERKILSQYGGGCHQKIGVSVLRRPYGEILFLRGLTDAGEVLDRVDLTPSDLQPKIRPAASEAAIFPREGEESAFFTREALGREHWGWAQSERYLWVARENALPADFQVHDEAIVWTAGLTTWKKLAERGVWVSGSSEGLGVSEATRIETIVGESDLPWVKLTHQGSHEAGLGNMRTCATYRLIERGEALDLRGRTHFFWTSGTAFHHALSLFPEIRNAHHACGPGLTYDQIAEALGGKSSVNVFLGVSAWREAVLERN